MNYKFTIFAGENMSQTSFITYCIEHYADHVARPSYAVYAEFKASGLLHLLRTDYDDLHGMGKEYLMQFFDRYLNQLPAQP